MDKPALVVVDVQQGLIEGFEDDWADVLPVIGHLAGSARSAEVPVTIVQHCGASPAHPLHCDAPGWALHPTLDPQPDDLRVGKAWSDAFQDTELHELLQAAAVTRIVLVGAQSEFCIDTSTRRATSLGYDVDVDVVADGHTTSENGVLSRAQIVAHTNQTLANLAVVGVTVRVPASADVTLGPDQRS